MINQAFTAYIENLGGDFVITGLLGSILAFVIVISMIDYIMD